MAEKVSKISICKKIEIESINKKTISDLRNNRLGKIGGIRDFEYTG